MRSRFAMLGLILVAAAARAADESTGAEPGQALLTYQARVGKSQVSGVSHVLDWTVVPLSAEKTRVRLRVPIASFDSGHRAFDQQLQAALEGGQSRNIEVEGIVTAGRFQGSISLHGAVQPLTVELQIWREGSMMIAHVLFPLDLARFGVALPQLDPLLTVELIARLHVDPAAILTGGVVTSSD